MGMTLQELIKYHDIWRGRPCPKCGKKGLHVADHQHASGEKILGTILPILQGQN
jgi:hypothetical protein